jgi:hypothetical protein
MKGNGNNVVRSGRAPVRELHARGPEGIGQGMTGQGLIPAGLTMSPVGLWQPHHRMGGGQAL